MDKLRLDYMYGNRGESYAFVQIPDLLLRRTEYRALSDGAKILYGLFLRRAAMSARNGWIDAENRVYIIYTVNEIMEDFGCAKATCIKMMKELDTESGIGLIEKKRRGQGKPAIIYVKDFSSIPYEKPELNETEEPEVPEGPKDSKRWNSMPEDQTEHMQETGNSLAEWQTGDVPDDYTDVEDGREVSFTEERRVSEKKRSLNFKKFKSYTSRSSKVEPLEVQNLDPSYIYRNNIDLNYISHPSIHLSEEENGVRGAPGSGAEDRIDRMDGQITDRPHPESARISEHRKQRQAVRKQIDYEALLHDRPLEKEYIDALAALIEEVLYTSRETISVGGERLPAELVKDRMRQLNMQHIRYVLDRLKETTTKIRNIRAYLLTALFNAPPTIQPYYSQLVLHDLYGD